MFKEIGQQIANKISSMIDQQVEEYQSQKAENVREGVAESLATDTLLTKTDAQLVAEHIYNALKAKMAKK